MVTRVREHFRDNLAGAEVFPTNATRILDAIREREPDFNRLVRVVGQDAAVVTRLLQVANSARYAAGGEVDNVRGAVLRIGLRSVGEIALGFASRSLFETRVRAAHAVFPARWDALFHDSMTSAFAAGALAMRARRGQVDGAFLGAMLHDVGKPIALRALAGLHLKAALRAPVFDAGLDEVIERAHVIVGGEMAARWKLPESLVEIIGRHHEDAPGAASDNLHLVRVIDGLRDARAGVLGASGRTRALASAAALGLGDADLRVAARDLEEQAAQVTAIFGVPDPLRATPAAA
jgi:putative nucleotidyltransferase with HDIG domain